MNLKRNPFIFTLSLILIIALFGESPITGIVSAKDVYDAKNNIYTSYDGATKSGAIRLGYISNTTSDTRLFNRKAMIAARYYVFGAPSNYNLTITSKSSNSMSNLTLEIWSGSYYNNTNGKGQLTIHYESNGSTTYIKAGTDSLSNIQLTLSIVCTAKPITPVPTTTAIPTTPVPTSKPTFSPSKTPLVSNTNKPKSSEKPTPIHSTSPTISPAVTTSAVNSITSAPPLLSSEHPSPSIPKTIIYHKTGKYQITSTNTVRLVKAKKTKKINIPSAITANNTKYKVTAIAPKAFTRNKITTTIVVGANIKKINKKMFYGCKSLYKIICYSKKITKKQLKKACIRRNVIIIH